MFDNLDNIALCGVNIAISYERQLTGVTSL